ncbi:MAG: hypothetical protein CVU55_00020 [Deltaproteobacteria bacterium HGW-Deltaproteobacteria-13]|jgi:hypothetical protein|nr:MAG: hypothetical protein CVU55_00020 [Deltaproteobacteria bacterium HGW-Deltaproteobacteria-13]
MRNTYGHIPTRYELNRLVRGVLTRHGANMELISISCTTRVVYLSGSLTKTIRPDYKVTDVDIIFRDIAKLPAVRSIYANLDNWIVSAVKSTGEWLVNRKGATCYQRDQVPLGRFTRFRKEKKEQSSDAEDE